VDLVDPGGREGHGSAIRVIVPGQVVGWGTEKDGRMEEKSERRR
jgi:hypothetical protein